MSFVGVGIIGILTLLLGLFFFLLHIAVCVWGYNDARRKAAPRICDPGCAGLVVLPCCWSHYLFANSK